MYAAASRQLRPPKLASTSETTGLKWAPETGPNMRMIAYRPAAVAAAFSSNFRPTSATGCGVMAALGFYHVTQPATIGGVRGFAQLGGRVPSRRYCGASGFDRR